MDHDRVPDRPRHGDRHGYLTERIAPDRGGGPPGRHRGGYDGPPAHAVLRSYDGPPRGAAPARHDPRLAYGAPVPLARPLDCPPARPLDYRRARTAVLVPDDQGAGTHMMVPAHVFLWLLSLEWAILRPDVHHNLGKWLGFLLSAQALALVPKFLVLAYYQRLRLLPWAVLWIPFEMLKRLFLLEALLAYQMRPVRPPLPVRGRFPTWRSMLRPGRPPAAENAGA